MNCFRGRRINIQAVISISPWTSSRLLRINFTGASYSIVILTFKHEIEEFTWNLGFIHCLKTESLQKQSAKRNISRIFLSSIVLCIWLKIPKSSACVDHLMILTFSDIFFDIAHNLIQCSIDSRTSSNYYFRKLGALSVNSTRSNAIHQVSCKSTLVDIGRY